MSGKYKLIYFDTRGRAEPIRILLHYANIPYEDVRITREKWEELKPGTPWGHVPILELPDGKIVSQTVSIIRFVSKHCHLYSDDYFEAAKIDECLYAITELSDDIIKLHLEQDQSKKEFIKHELMNKKIPVYFKNLSKIHLEGEGSFLLCSRMTLADVVLANLLENLEVMMGAGISSQYPALQSIREVVWKEPKIQGYLEQRK